MTGSAASRSRLAQTESGANDDDSSRWENSSVNTTKTGASGFAKVKAVKILEEDSSSDEDDVSVASYSSGDDSDSVKSV